MTQEQITKLDYEACELLSSSVKDIGSISPAIIQKVSNKKQSARSIFANLPSNWSKARQFISPLLIANFRWGPQYEISNTRDNRLEKFIANKISEIREVEYIIISKRENYYEIWTIIDKLDREVRKNIYDIEYDILENIKGLYFDFHVICRNGRDPKELFSPQSKLIFQRYN
jgi:hypothetical protein